MLSLALCCRLLTGGGLILLRTDFAGLFTLPSLLALDTSFWDLGTSRLFFKESVECDPIASSNEPILSDSTSGLMRRFFLGRSISLKGNSYFDLNSISTASERDCKVPSVDDFSWRKMHRGRVH